MSNAGLNYIAYNNNPDSGGVLASAYETSKNMPALYAQMITYFKNNTKTKIREGTITALFSGGVSAFTPSGSMNYGAAIISGYFIPTQTANWTFYLGESVTIPADDAAMVFLGPEDGTIIPNNTFSSLSTSLSNTTPILYNSYVQSSFTYNTTISLTADVAYPILIYYIQGFGGYIDDFKFSVEGGTLISDFTGYMTTGTVGIETGSTPVIAPTDNTGPTVPINITPLTGSGFSYDGVDIANLVKVGTSSVSASYKTLPLGNSATITDTLSQIDKIGYYDTKLTDTNLAHYYTAYEIATTSTNIIPYSNISNYKHAKFLLIGGGGGGGGSAGVAWIYSLTNKTRNGGSGGSGGLGGINLQTGNIPISSGNINITIGAGGAGGNRFTRGDHPFGPNDGRPYSRNANVGGNGGSTSIIINGVTYNANGGSGGNIGNYGYGDSNGNNGTPGGSGTNVGGTISSYPQYSGYGNGGAGGVARNGPRANGQDGNPGTSGNYGFAAIYLFRKP